MTKIEESLMTVSKITGSNGQEYFGVTMHARLKKKQPAHSGVAIDDFVEQYCNLCPLYMSGANFNRNLGIICHTPEVRRNQPELIESFATCNLEDLGNLTQALCQIASNNPSAGDRKLATMIS